MYWQRELAFLITPKSGPLRPMTTLLDASRAITQDLPAAYRKQDHWRDVGWGLCRAAESGAQADIRAATEKLVDVLEGEGWMRREPTAAHRLGACFAAMAEPLRACIADAEVRPQRPVLKVVARSDDRAAPAHNRGGALAAQGDTNPARRKAAS